MPRAFRNPGGELAAVIATYVKGATRGVPAGQLAGNGSLAASATAGVNLYLAGLSPEQRELAKRGGNPLDPAALHAFQMKLHGEHALFGLGKNGDQSRSNGSRFASLKDGSASQGIAGGGADPAFLRSVGLSDATGKALAALGFKSPEQIRQVVADTNKLGLSPQKAAVDLARLRKAEGARTDEHVDALKHYGDALKHAREMEKDAAKIQDATQRAEAVRKAAETRNHAEQALKQHRDQRVKTPDGKKSFDKVRDDIRSEDHHEIGTHGRKAVHDESHRHRVTANKRAGTEREIEEARRKQAVALKQNPNVAKSDEDVIAGLIDKKEGQEMAARKKEDPIKTQPKTDSVPENRHSAGNAKSEKSPQQRQAVNKKTLNPTV